MWRAAVNRLKEELSVVARRREEEEKANEARQRERMKRERERAEWVCVA